MNDKKHKSEPGQKSEYDPEITQSRVHVLRIKGFGQPMVKFDPGIFQNDPGPFETETGQDSDGAKDDDCMDFVGGKEIIG